MTKGLVVFPHGTSLLLVVVVIAVTAISNIGWSVVWIVFAVTLVVTTLVAIHRSIPRKER